MAAQDTGNPVLDSTVNVLVAMAARFSMDDELITRVHASLLKAAALEPGGLKVRGHEGRVAQATAFEGG